MFRSSTNLSALLTYVIVIVFAALFVAVNWSGPGRVLSLASVAVIACALLALHSKSFTAAVGAVLLLVPLPLIAVWTNAGSATARHRAAGSVGRSRRLANLEILKESGAEAIWLSRSAGGGLPLRV